MSDFDTARDEILAIYTELAEIAGRRGADVTARRLDTGRQRLLDGRLTVVIVGEFKRGKSSLVNALLDEYREPLLFPEAGEIATNVVTTVSYADQEQISVVLETSNRKSDVVQINRSDIAHYVTESGNPNNTRRARLIEIQTPHPKLASGLTLVDTPGVGGIFAEHTAATMAFLPSADAIVFVTDATQPLLEGELRFLRRAIESLRAVDSPDALQFVLTKIDIGEYQGLLANTRQKIAGLLGWDPDEVIVTPVSAHAKRDYLRDGDQEDLELSNFPQFESVLWSGLNRWRAKRLLGAALEDLERATGSLLNPLDEELVALGDGSDRQVAGMAGQAQVRQRALREMQGTSAIWRNDLAKELTAVGRELNNRGQDGLDRVWHRFRFEYLEEDTYLLAPTKLVDQLGLDAATVVAELNEIATRRMAAILSSFTSRIGMDLNSPELKRLPDPPVPSIAVTGNIGGGDQLGRFQREMHGLDYGVGIGSTVGGLIGILFGPPGMIAGSLIGAVIGAGVGYTTGRRDEAAADRSRRQSRLRAELATLENAQRRHVKEAVAVVLDGFGAAVLVELESRIAAERESVADLVARLDEAKLASRSKAQTRTSELTAERAPLLRVRARVRGLATIVEELSGDPRSTRKQQASAAADPANAARETVAAGVVDGSWADE